MWKSILAKVGSVIVAIATFVLSITIPATSWIDENRAIYISIMAIIALLIGGILWFFGNKIVKSEFTKVSKLSDLVPILEKMDSILNEQAKKESKKKFDLQKYTDFNTKINAEIFGIKPQKIVTPETMRRATQRETERLIKEYGNKKDEWLERAKILSGVYDVNGFGLKQFRDKGKYKRLMKTLTNNRNYVSDESLNSLIKEHIMLSEILNNMVMVEERAMKLKATYEAKQYSIKDFVNSTIMGGLGNLDRDVRERIIETRTKIVKRIQELENKNTE